MKTNITIVLAAYNVEEYIQKCLDSLLSQDCKNFHLIAINDGSTDGSLRILQKNAKFFKSIKIIDQGNSSLGAVRNLGVQEATTEWIVFLDDDDWLDRDFVASYNDAIENQLGTDVICGGYKRVNESHQILEKSLPINKISSEDVFESVLSSRSSSMVACKAIRRRLFTDNQIKFPVNEPHEDVFVLYKILYYCRKLSYIENYGYNWLFRNNSLSSSFEPEYIETFERMFIDGVDFLHEKNIYENYKNALFRKILHFYLGIPNKLLSSPDTHKADYLISISITKLHGLLDIEDVVKDLESYDLEMVLKYNKFAPYRLSKGKVINMNVSRKRLQNVSTKYENSLKMVENISEKLDRIDTQCTIISKNMGRLSKITSPSQMIKSLSKFYTRYSKNRRLAGNVK